MLVRFSSDAHENITMFGDVAIKLIKMMGHSGTVPSAILAKDVPEALSNLKAALAKGKGASTPNDPLHEDDVSLSNRAWPLIELLQDSIDGNCNVMWSQA